MKNKSAQYAFIKKHAKKYPITMLVEMTKVSRSGYYKWLKREGIYTQDVKDEELRPLLVEIFEEHRETIGRKRMKIELYRKHGLIVNEKRVRRLMKKYGLFCKIRRKRFRNYLDAHAIVPNILNRNFTAVHPRKKFCIDITYIPTPNKDQKWMYLCGVIDLFNGELVAYSIDTNQRVEMVYEALERLKEKGFAKGAILHSDQGTQFTNPGYRMRVKNMGLTQSMSRRGNCWDNACIENFFSHLKVEMPHFSQPKTMSETVQAVENYIYYYNHKRVCVKLKGSPVEYKLNSVA